MCSTPFTPPLSTNFEQYMSSRLPGFYKTPPQQRRDIVAKNCGIEDVEIFAAQSLPMEKADIMVENAIGTFALPLAVAVV